MSARQRAKTEWSRMQDVPEGRTRVQAFNDGSLELLTAAARIYSLFGVILGIWLCPLVGIWLGPVGWAMAAAHVLLVAVSGWWGWWEYGDDNWGLWPRRRRDAG